MKLTAPELLRLRVIDEVILEPAGGAHLAPAIAYREVDQALFRHPVRPQPGSGQRTDRCPVGKIQTYGCGPAK